MKRYIYLSCGVLFIGTFTVVSNNGSLSQDFVKHATNMLSVVAALICIACVSYAVKIMGNDRTSLPWKFLLAGFFLYGLGELSWLIYESFLGIDPFPSWADVYWLTGYVPLFVGMWINYRQIEIPLEWRDFLIVHAIFIIAVILVGYLLLWPVIISQKIGLIEKFLDVAYPLLDLGLLLTAIFIAVLFGKGLLSRPWIGMALSFAMFSLADTWFTYLTFFDKYQTGHPVDVIWVSAYIIAAISALEYLELTSKEPLQFIF